MRKNTANVKYFGKDRKYRKLYKLQVEDALKRGIFSVYAEMLHK